MESDRDLLQHIHAQATSGGGGGGGGDSSDDDEGGYDDDDRESVREQIPTRRRQTPRMMDDAAERQAQEEENVLSGGGGGGPSSSSAKRGVSRVVDHEAVQVEEAFLSHLTSDAECQANIQSMLLAGRSTLWVDFSRLTEHNMDLGSAICEYYYRFRPYLDAALRRAVNAASSSTGQDAIDSSFQVSFHAVPLMDRVRDLRTDRIGKLISVSGTVTRTSETRPELLVGRFLCQSCGALSDAVEQEFKYSEPAHCQTAGCAKTSASAFSSSWKLDAGKSQFCDWQKIRVQENAQEVPAGSMPRSIEVIARHESVEQAKPGDKCVFTGTLIVVPEVSRLRAPGDPRGNSDGSNSGRSAEDATGTGFTGLHALGVRDLTYTLHFLACAVQQCDGFGMTASSSSSSSSSGAAALEDQAGYDYTRKELRERVRDTFTEEERQECEQMRLQPNLLDKLTRSFAPAIYGHSDIKLGVLLLLFGGVHKRTMDKINLRGDINVCIVGDPSTAKSQFLRYVCHFSPRAVYTSGKSSTAAGLTASVVRDAETGEFCIEAGALMLADNGVCCIDEFEKMDDIDQVAIHEAMEQQTLSITKAGIQATLNARTSVLAAANPIYGRYDRSKTLKSNLTIGAAIMSRFDLFFIVLDEVDETNDRAIADHILRVHQRRTRGVNDDEEEEEEEEDVVSTAPYFSCEQLQRYVKYARTIDPICSTAVQPKLVECYVKLRLGDAGVGANRQAYRITVRQLEALVRLSEAIARLHLDAEIREEHVEKAYHLLKTSIVQVESDSVLLHRTTSSTSTSTTAASTSTTDAMSQAEFQRLGAEMQRYLQRHGGRVRHSLVVDYVMEHCLPELQADKLDDTRRHVNALVSRLVGMDVLAYVDEDQDQDDQERDELDEALDADVPQEERRVLAVRADLAATAATAAAPAGDDAEEEDNDDLLVQESVAYVTEYCEAAQGDDGFVGVPQADLINHLMNNVLPAPPASEEEDAEVQERRRRRRLNRRVRELLVRPGLLVQQRTEDSAYESGTPVEEQFVLSLPSPSS